MYVWNCELHVTQKTFPNTAWPFEPCRVQAAIVSRFVCTVLDAADRLVLIFFCNFSVILIFFLHLPHPWAHFDETR